MMIASTDVLVESGDRTIERQTSTKPSQKNHGSFDTSPQSLALYWVIEVAYRVRSASGKDPAMHARAAREFRGVVVISARAQLAERLESGQCSRFLRKGAF
jgi:hypothetical protein